MEFPKYKWWKNHNEIVLQNNKFIFGVAKNDCILNK